MRTPTRHIQKFGVNQKVTDKMTGSRARISNNFNESECYVESVDEITSSNDPNRLSVAVYTALTRSAPYFVWSRNEQPILLDAQPCRAFKTVVDRRSRLKEFSHIPEVPNEYRSKPNLNQMTPFSDVSTMIPQDGCESQESQPRKYTERALASASAAASNSQSDSAYMNPQASSRRMSNFHHNNLNNSTSNMNASYVSPNHQTAHQYSPDRKHFNNENPDVYHSPIAMPSLIMNNTSPGASPMSAFRHPPMSSTVIHNNSNVNNGTVASSLSSLHASTSSSPLVTSRTTKINHYNVVTHNNSVNSATNYSNSTLTNVTSAKVPGNNAPGIDYWSSEDLRTLRDGLIAADNLERAALRARGMKQASSSKGDDNSMSEDATGMNFTEKAIGGVTTKVDTDYEIDEKQNISNVNSSSDLLSVKGELVDNAQNVAIESSTLKSETKSSDNKNDDGRKTSLIAPNEYSIHNSESNAAIPKYGSNNSSSSTTVNSNTDFIPSTNTQQQQPPAQQVTSSNEASSSPSIFTLPPAASCSHSLSAEEDAVALILMDSLLDNLQGGGRDWKWFFISQFFYLGNRTAMGVRSKCIRLLDAVRRKGGPAAATLAMHANGPLVSGNAATPVVVAAVNIALEKMEGRPSGRR